LLLRQLWKLFVFTCKDFFEHLVTSGLFS